MFFDIKGIFHLLYLSISLSFQRRLSWKGALGLRLKSASSLGLMNQKAEKLKNGNRRWSAVPKLGQDKGMLDKIMEDWKK